MRVFVLQIINFPIDQLLITLALFKYLFQIDYKTGYLINFQIFTAVIIDQTEAGVHAQHVRMTPNARHLVTWCPEPREKTLRCWSFLDNELSFLASLTPDQEVCSIVYLKKY